MSYSTSGFELKTKNNFYFPICSGTGAIHRRKQNRNSAKLASPGREKRLSSKSFIRRAMTVGELYKENKEQNCASQKRLFDSDTIIRKTSGFHSKSPSAILYTSTFSNNLNEIHNRKQLDLIKSESIATKSQLSSELRKMKNENSELGRSEITKFNMEKLLSADNSTTSGRSRTADITSPQNEASTTSTFTVFPYQSKNYYHSTGNPWGFSMALLVLVIISTFSASSAVMGLPLGQENVGGRKLGTQQRNNGLMTPNLRMSKKSLPLDNEAAVYSLQPKGQLYLQSAMNKVPVKAMAAGAVSSSDYPIDGAASREKLEDGEFEDDDQSTLTSHQGTSKYHLQRVHLQPQNSEADLLKHSSHIQKLLNNPRGVTGGKETDDFYDDADADIIRSNENSGESNSLGEYEWEAVADPHIYVLTEGRPNLYQPQQPYPLFHQQRKRRNSGTGPSLSIVNPLDVLRQRLLLEIARRRMRQSHNQIIANEEILRKIGRRRR